MKRTFLLSFTAILFFSSCSYIGGKRIKGNGNIRTETRTAGQFSNIDVSGAIDVYVRQDSANSVKVETDENLMEYIDIRNDRGTLTIHPKNRYNPKPSKAIKVYVSSPLFKDFEATGACGIYSENKFTSSNNITINITGASTVKMELNAPGIKADLTGASHIILKGETKNFSVDGSGATSIRCFELMTENTDVDLTGAGNAEVFASVKLDVHVSGAANVKYKGNAVVNKEINGAGSVRKMD